MRRASFTLIEIVLALGIFAVGVVFLLERRNTSLEGEYLAIQTLRAQGIIDEIIADYRLHPFSKESRPLEKDYSPFVVKVDVKEESINIIPEDWRVPELELTEEQEKKKRVILRINVNVGFSGLGSDKIVDELDVSTLIRHIELDDGEDDA